MKISRKSLLIIDIKKMLLGYMPYKV